MSPPGNRPRKFSLDEIRARAGSLEPGTFHHRVLCWDIVFALFDSAKEPGDFLDLLRSIERQYPTLRFSDFVIAAALAEKSVREATAEVEARQPSRLH